MKAIGYQTAHEMDAFSLHVVDVPLSAPKPQDVRVRIKAISVNPVDCKVRRTRNAKDDRPVILGWDAAGVIEEVGPEVQGFAVGDEVYYAGDVLRDGSYAEAQNVDYRVIARKPASLSFEEAAALPLTSITAWEAMLEHGFHHTGHSNVLIIGGAGGVGSMAIQLLKAQTPVQVIATASRPETVAWCKKQGADIVIDHRQSLAVELKKNGVEAVDVVFGTTHSINYLDVIPQILRPFGHFCLIDDPKVLDIAPFKPKALSVHWEYMFAKTMHGVAQQTQGEILSKVAHLVDAGKVHSTVNQVLKGLTIENIRHAHALMEKGASVGKVVIAVA